MSNTSLQTYIPKPLISAIFFSFRVGRFLFIVFSSHANISNRQYTFWSIKQLMTYIQLSVLAFDMIYLEYKRLHIFKHET